MNIYMIGIGGIGMSALAQLYRARGYEVSGEDRSPGPTTDLLIEKGMSVTIGESVAPSNTDLVVFSDAVPPEQSARTDARERSIRQATYFQALGEASQGAFTIAVSGTNGKTTTTAMLTKILVDAGKNPTAVIGSIVKDFGSNFVEGDPTLFVVEACEYKDHMLELHPNVLVITNIEWDHTDWFKTEADLKATFARAKAMVLPGGVVVDASVYGSEPSFELGLIGEFNKDNARAAAAAARAAFPEITTAEIAQSLKTFQGSWRRFEYIGKTAHDVPVYDDYAHHPSAIRETLRGVREKFPNTPITVAFHPHLYSRTKDLFEGFVKELALADRIILAPIFPAREVDDGSVSSSLLAGAIKKFNPHVQSLPDFEAISSELSTLDSGLIITMGAGDIYKVAEKIVIHG